MGVSLSRCRNGHEYSDADTRPDGSHRCTQCLSTAKTRYRSRGRHKDIDRNSSYQRRYGITLDEYNTKLAQQHGVCAICGDGPGKRKLCVDHDHKTNDVRDLLCFRCNVGIGSFLDDPLRLQAATAYIERWQN